MILHPPCEHCDDRNLGCHEICIEYLNFKNQNFEIKRQRREEKIIDYLANTMNRGKH